MKRFVIFIVVAIILSSCTSLHKVEDVAEKSYEIGCLNGFNNPIVSYTCHQKAKLFRKDIHKAWTEGI